MTILKKVLLRFEGYFAFLICALFIKSFLIAVKPFVFLHFTATIINDLYSEKQIVFRAFWLLICIMAIEIGGHLASRYVDIVTQRVSYNQSLSFLIKLCR